MASTIVPSGKGLCYQPPSANTMLDKSKKLSMCSLGVVLGLVPTKITAIARTVLIRMERSLESAGMNPQGASQSSHISHSAYARTFCQSGEGRACSRIWS